jgi:hypothetical protein
MLAVLSVFCLAVQLAEMRAEQKVDWLGEKPVDGLVVLMVDERVSGLVALSAAEMVGMKVSAWDAY